MKVQNMYAIDTSDPKAVTSLFETLIEHHRRQRQRSLWLMYAAFLTGILAGWALF